MPRKNKGIFSVALSAARVKEDARVSRTQEPLTEVMRRNAIQSSCPDPLPQAFVPGFFQQFFSYLNYSNRAICDDQDDYTYEDDGEDDEYAFDDDWDDSPASSPLPPHPNLRQLTQEEADEHTKELEERERRQKEKLEKNRQKKLVSRMRQKERRRLDKENKEKSSEVELDSSSGSRRDARTPSEEKSDQPDVAVETESVGGDPDEPLKAGDLQAGVSPPTRGQSVSPATVQRKGGGRKKKRKDTPSRERRPPQRGLLPGASQTPPLPGAPGSAEKGTVNGALEDYSQRAADLAEAGLHLALGEQYEQAVEYFTEAIKHSPKEYKLFGNRSFCYERLQQYDAALQDADLALLLKPHWVKGLFRRGKALCGLKRYFDASLTYKDILRQDGSSEEASKELKRAQTLNLMEMGFSWEQSCEALREHGSLEDALEAHFGGEGGGGAEPEEGSAVDSNTVEEEEEEEDEEEDEEGQWTVLGPSRPRQPRRERAVSPKPVSTPKWEMYSVWVGSLSPTLTIPTLHTLFNRVGAVTSVNMLVEQQCAFINYTRMEDCDRAIQLMDGYLVEGTPLAVRYPNRFLKGLKNQGSNALPASRNLKECFFWRTSGCTRAESCGYKHVPEHKHIDRDKLRH